MSTENLINKLKFGSSQTVPVLMQAEASECGITCLAMIASYYGHHVNMLEVRNYFDTSSEGTSLKELLDFATAMHFTTRALRIELEELKYISGPAILHWDMNHFVVLTRVTKKYVFINDPACGERRLSWGEVSEHFTGVIAELAPTAEFKSKEKAPPLKLSHLWSKIHGFRKTLLFLFSFSLILQLFALISPFYIQLVVDEAITSSDTPLLLTLFVGFLLVLTFETTAMCTRNFSLQHFGNKMNLQLGVNLFQHLIRLPLRYFENRHVGDIVSRFTSMERVKTMLTEDLIQSVLDGIMALITLLLIFSYSVTLSLLVLGATLIYLFARLVVYRPYRKFTEQEIQARADENSNFIETVQGMQTIKLMGAESKRQDIWVNYNVRALNNGIKLGSFQIAYGTFLHFLNGVENLVVIFFAASLVLSNELTLGMMFAFLAYKTQFTSKSNALIDKLIEFKMLGVHLDRLSDVVLTKKENTFSADMLDQDIQGRISIRALDFSYTNDSKKILNNIHLDIKQGESLAITGPSGCGKSTLLKVMLGILEPANGEVLIDETPLQKIRD